jgi:hypothetical protein
MCKYNRMNEMFIQAIKQGISEYKRLSQERKALDIQMQKLLQLVAANVNMLPDAEQESYIAQLIEMTPPSGLSEAILRVLKTDEWLSPIEVRDRLIEAGYDFAGQVNPLASIHTTLKRMVPKDAIANVPQPDGKTYYKKTETARGLTNLNTLAGMLGIQEYAPAVRLRDLVQKRGEGSMVPRTRLPKGLTPPPLFRGEEDK